MKEVIIKTQKEWDELDKNFDGIVYFENGQNWIIIKENKGCRRIVRSSRVVAREYSSVVAWEHSSVVAQGNTQIVDITDTHDLKITGNARIVYMPKAIQEFMDFYGIKKVGRTRAIFYKAVEKDANGIYRSTWNSNFTYEIGKTKTENCDPDIEESCSYGINISHLDWALRFGSDWNNLAILEVETRIDDIVLPKCTDGKVRTSKVKVLREVPLEECGVYGKILAKRRKNNG